MRATLVQREAHAPVLAATLKLRQSDLAAFALRQFEVVEEPPVAGFEVAQRLYAAGDSLILDVPSAIVPEESILIINATHPDAGLLKAATVRRFMYEHLFRPAGALNSARLSNFPVGFWACLPIGSVTLHACWNT
ncbi:MAG TPA: hypothetical protein VF292_07770 [Rhodanobacteraceae bacterium]